MFILHIALQGCLRAENVAYGITADTGGHIRYLLELVEASGADPRISRIVVATRAFDSSLGAEYAAPNETLSGKAEIVRLRTDSPQYRSKEEMHEEVPSFARALIGYLKAQPQLPDMIHAHYADAASVAALIEDELGIPFVFTAHSLGRVKRQSVPSLAGNAALSQRIACEEKALSRAALVVASSRDEAEVQYAGYEAYEPGRIRIIAPGSDLTAFSQARRNPEVDTAIDRFLTDPEKPAILAIARPVAKKNLSALVEAFGRSPELRQRANLVIVAGTRDDLATLDGEMADTLRELLYLIDRHDLYGHVAYPKSHRSGDIPAFYAYARDRRGIFANPALNEPFGLTLLEASAAGLPLIATDSGGPNDIIETCGNGELVDPRSPDAITSAALRILGDTALWDRYAKAGARAANAYDWPRHAERYHALVASLVAHRSVVQPEPQPSIRQLLLCDIDNTLVGCEDCVRSFSQWRFEQEGLGFGVATGRSFHSAMSILEQQNTPKPQVLITSVGSEIYHLDPNGTTYTADAIWRSIVSRNWDVTAAASALAGLDGLTPQAPLEQRSHKLSYFTHGAADIAPRVRARLERAGLRCSVIHSHNRYLDVLPVRASKGSAVEFVRKLYGLSPHSVFVAGDSGNDIEMLRTIPQAIIVANYSDGLAALPDLSHSYVARASYARGIIEGVDHFRARRSAPACKQAS